MCLELGGVKSGWWNHELCVLCVHWGKLCCLHIRTGPNVLLFGRFGWSQYGWVLAVENASHWTLLVVGEV